MSDNDATQTRQDDAAKQLRAMLDERGVSWDYGPSGASSTAFWVNGKELSFSNWRDGLVCSTIFTPAQAIAATLGAGTCTLINAADDLGSGTSSCMCFECGYTALDDWWEEFNFCPNCGRRIEVTE